MVKTAIIRHEDGKWVVRTHDGSRILGTHDTREDAEKQLYAIEINKKKSFNSRTASDVNWQLLGPCTGDKNCSTCMHFDELLHELKPQSSAEGKAKPMSAADKRQKKSLQDLKKHHQQGRARVAAVTQKSLSDFYKFVPEGWRVISHGRPVVDPVPNEHHDLVVLHHPGTNNRVRVYDHGIMSEALSHQVWNIYNPRHIPQLHQMMSTLNQHKRNTTLDLTHHPVSRGQADEGIYGPLDKHSGILGYTYGDDPHWISVKAPSWGSSTSDSVETLLHEIAHSKFDDSPQDDHHLVALLGQSVAHNEQNDPNRSSRIQKALRGNWNSMQKWNLHKILGARVNQTRWEDHAYLPFSSMGKLGQHYKDNLQAKSGKIFDRFHSLSAPAMIVVGHNDGIYPSSHPYSPLLVSMVANAPRGGVGGVLKQEGLSMNPHMVSSLNEFRAQHFADWKNPSPEVKPTNFTRLMAHHFNWGPNPKGIRPLENPADVFGESDE